MFLKFSKILKLHFNNISEIVRDRAKPSKFGDHMYCQCSHVNIFQHLENFKKQLQTKAIWDHIFCQ